MGDIGARASALSSISMLRDRPVYRAGLAYLKGAATAAPLPAATAHMLRAARAAFAENSSLPAVVRYGAHLRRRALARAALMYIFVPRGRAREDSTLVRAPTRRALLFFLRRFSSYTTIRYRGTGISILISSTFLALFVAARGQRGVILLSSFVIFFRPTTFPHLFLMPRRGGMGGGALDDHFSAWFQQEEPRSRISVIGRADAGISLIIICPGSRRRALSRALRACLPADRAAWCSVRAACSAACALYAAFCADIAPRVLPACHARSPHARTPRRQRAGAAARARTRNKRRFLSWLRTYIFRACRASWLLARRHFLLP